MLNIRVHKGALGLRLRNLCLVSAGLLALMLASSGARAALVATGVCGIQVDKRMSVYKVMVEGAAYRGKGYLTYQDALALREVLLSTGTCKKVPAPKRCEIKTLAAFDFAIFRDGENFDRYAKLRTLKQARAYAKALVNKKLCVMKDS